MSESSPITIEKKHSNEIEKKLIEIEKSFRSIVPKSFSEINALAADLVTVKKFEDALQNQNGNSVLKELSQNVKKLYTVLAPKGSEQAAKNQAVHEAHQTAKVAEIFIKLKGFVEDLSQYEGTLPKHYLDAYRDQAREFQKLSRAVMFLGTPEFAKFHRSKEEWEANLDPIAASEGNAKLRYEDDARQALEAFQASSEQKNKNPTTRETALQYWKFSDEEIKYLLGNEPLLPETSALSAEQGVRAFEILFRRAGLQEWKVNLTSSSKAISVNAAAKEINFPVTRKLSGDDILYILSHEMVHVIRGENGSRQECGLLGTGIPGYVTNEEGAATVSEMLSGQEFGHERQATFAARYLAISLALQTKIEKNRRVPKFSPQEIYNQIASYGVKPDVATQILWRIFRGTSLKREVVDIPFGANTLPIAETYVKDAIYFEGQIELLNELLKQSGEIISGTREIPTIGKKPARDFTTRLLARIGLRQIEATDTDNPKINKEQYDRFVQLGKEKLMNILQGFLLGKLTFEALSSNTSPWKQALKKSEADGIIQYEKLFAAVPAENTEQR